MKTILMSIRPEWVYKIFTGQKTIELRKTAPKPPFRVVVYCTQSLPPWEKHLYVNPPDKREDYSAMDWWTAKSDSLKINAPPYEYNAFLAHGKVVGEFICDRVDTVPVDSEAHKSIAIDSCLTTDQIIDYCNGKDLKALHVTAPQLYDKPRALSRFYTSLPDKILDSGDYDCRLPGNTLCLDAPEGGDHCPDCKYGGRKAVSRPPQSWQYITDPEVCDE